jgi:hypothetical protein
MYNTENYWVIRLPPLSKNPVILTVIVILFLINSINFVPMESCYLHVKLDCTLGSFVMNLHSKQVANDRKISQDQEAVKIQDLRFSRIYDFLYILYHFLYIAVN